MEKIKIKKPIWKTRSVGIAENKITDDLNIKITYRKADGDLLYPDDYFISAFKARLYPVQYWRGVKLHIIPINDLIPMRRGFCGEKVY